MGCLVPLGQSCQKLRDKLKIGFGNGLKPGESLINSKAIFPGNLNSVGPALKITVSPYPTLSKREGLVDR